MAKIGRPKKEIDWKLFEELCHIQCTETEIAAVLGMCRDTLEDKVKEQYGSSFSTVYKQKREGGKTSLRRAQWLTATESKNAIMQIFLGKNMLGQSDKQEVKITGTDIKVVLPEFESDDNPAESE